MNKKIIIGSIIAISIVASLGIILKNQDTKIHTSEDVIKKEESSSGKEKESNKLEQELKEKEARQKAINEKLDKAEWLLYQNYSDKYERSIDLCNEVINEDTNNYRAYTIRGLDYAYLTVRDYENKERALKDLDKALEIKNDYGYGRFNKGLAYAIFGELQDALNWYDKALEVEDYVWSYYGKAATYGRLGDAENSAKYIKEAIKRKDSIRELLKEEHDFDPIRDTEVFKEAIK